MTITSPPEFKYEKYNTIFSPQHNYLTVLLTQEYGYVIVGFFSPYGGNKRSRRVVLPLPKSTLVFPWFLKDRIGHYCGFGDVL